MKIICPNLKNKEVAREFEELKNATSEAAAYHIWSQNNGNGIDKAPNGEPSKLFSSNFFIFNCINLFYLRFTTCTINNIC